MWRDVASLSSSSTAVELVSGELITISSVESDLFDCGDFGIAGIFIFLFVLVTVILSSDSEDGWELDVDSESESLLSLILLST